MLKFALIVRKGCFALNTGTGGFDLIKSTTQMMMMSIRTKEFLKFFHTMKQRYNICHLNRKFSFVPTIIASI